MKVQFAGLVTAVLVLLGAANSPLAHHSFGVEFDSTKCMDLTGPLTGIEWENPHAWLRMDVKEPSGKVPLAAGNDHAERAQAKRHDAGALREQNRQGDAREGLRRQGGCLHV